MMFTDRDMLAWWFRMPPYILTYSIIHLQVMFAPLGAILSISLVLLMAAGLFIIYHGVDASKTVFILDYEQQNEAQLEVQL